MGIKSFIKSSEAVKKAKGGYKCTLKTSHGVWRRLEQITGYQIKSWPDELHAVCRGFDSVMEGHPSFRTEEYEVRNITADSISPAAVKCRADTLAPVFTDIFNCSLRVCRVPACVRAAAIIPAPKKLNISRLDDYRPVALTSVVMKSVSSGI